MSTVCGETPDVSSAERTMVDDRMVSTKRSDSLKQIQTLGWGQRAEECQRKIDFRLDHCTTHNAAFRAIRVE